MSACTESIPHPRRVAAAVALLLAAAPALLGAQRQAATMLASATVVAHPSTIRSLARPAGAAGLDATAGAWRLSGVPGAPIVVAFTLPDTLAPAAAAGGLPLPIASRRATAHWRRPGDPVPHRFDAATGAVVVLGDAGDPSIQLALAWTPRPAAVPRRGSYRGLLALTLVYY